MARLFWGQIPIERACALFFYSPHHESSRAIHELKYYDGPSVGEYLGRMLGQEGRASGFFDGIDLIVPVPLSRSRESQRGYNQSEEIARGISRVTGIEVGTAVVRRIRFDKSQTQMTADERYKNVQGAFKLLQPKSITGKHILLVDDIITTGATVRSCAQELMKAPDISISIAAAGFTKK